MGHESVPCSLTSAVAILKNFLIKIIFKLENGFPLFFSPPFFVPITSAFFCSNTWEVSSN